MNLGLRLAFAFALLCVAALLSGEARVVMGLLGGLALFAAFVLIPQEERVKAERTRPSWMWSLVLAGTVTVWLIVFWDGRSNDELALNSFYLLLSLGPFWMLWWLLRQHSWSRFLLVVCGVVAGWFVWAYVTRDMSAGKFPLGFVFLWITAICAWQYVLWGCVSFARRTVGRLLVGPLSEIFLMVMVFAPFVGAAVDAPRELGLNDHWNSIVVLGVSLFMSSVVAVPLRQLMLDIFGLTPGKTGAVE